MEKQILRSVVQSSRGDPQNHADFIFYCPGCKCGHGVWTTKRNCQNAVWSFNGSMNSPTFAPSILIKSVINPPEDKENGDFKRDSDGKYLLGSDGRLLGAKESICHSFLRDGHIQYLPDCTHELAGKTIPMEPF